LYFLAYPIFGFVISRQLYLALIVHELGNKQFCVAEQEVKDSHDIDMEPKPKPKPKPSQCSNESKKRQFIRLGMFWNWISE
jgi:hypothetical protein